MNNKQNSMSQYNFSYLHIIQEVKKQQSKVITIDPKMDYMKREKNVLNPIESTSHEE